LKEFKVESVSKTFFFERKNLRLLFKSDSKYKKKAFYLSKNPGKKFPQKY